MQTMPRVNLPPHGVIRMSQVHQRKGHRWRKGRVPVTGDTAPLARGAGPDCGRTPHFDGIQDGTATYTVGSGHSTFVPVDHPS